MITRKQENEISLFIPVQEDDASYQKNMRLRYVRTNMLHNILYFRIEEISSRMTEPKRIEDVCPQSVCIASQTSTFVD